jgi:ankyrin repeat domain-containing protein 50
VTEALQIFLTLENEGVIIYAALTVLKWPESFLKDGTRVNSYALPMFVVGTTILTLGMFFCAFLVERLSKKRFLTLPEESRVYWVQPGNQGVGDQKLPSFVGQTDKGALFTRSVRHHSPNEVLNVSKGILLMTALSSTIVGYLIQFVGLRGLHPSVILAQLGLTIVMTVVRTSLRAQRMHEGDNMLKDDQDIVCNGEHELDWLVFHLFKIRSFKIQSVSSSSM